MTSLSAYFGHFDLGLDANLLLRFENVKISKIDDFLNKNYHDDVAFFPKKVRDNETDDYIAWKVGRNLLRQVAKIGCEHVVHKS